MSSNPFKADPAIPARLASLGPELREAVQQAAKGVLASRARAPLGNEGSVIPRAVAEDLIGRFQLSSVRELMLLLLDVAKGYAHPSISDFHVGAVGLEAETGNLILGGNVEFPGSHLGYTLHGEGFVVIRAMSRGANISTLAIGEAHPCAHCRQCLAEYARCGELELIDPLGHTLSLAQLYPWPFDPAYLGEPGAVPGRVLWPELAFEASSGHPEAAALLAVGRYSHSPYSRCPGAVVLTLADGNRVSGIAMESVAFNPTIQPIQAAIVNLLAHGYGYADIREAVLGTVVGGAVDYSRSTAELLSSLSPDIRLTVLGWWG
ncbi:MAG: hypothetical protein J0H20_17095 [Rhizobiales bacterium]|nr:hypothetical protein [Hyphomicrobiales bacterium]